MVFTGLFMSNSWDQIIVVSQIYIYDILFNYTSTWVPEDFLYLQDSCPNMGLKADIVEITNLTITKTKAIRTVAGLYIEAKERAII